MNTLLLTFISLSVLFVVYGIFKIFVLAREYNYRRSVFDHRGEGRDTYSYRRSTSEPHVEGRDTERRREDRRTEYLSMA